MNDDRHDSLEPPHGGGIEEAGVWIRDTLGRVGGGFYHLGYSSARSGAWESIEDLRDDSHLEEFRLVAEGLRAHVRGAEGLVTLVGDDQTSGRARCFLAFQLARLLAEGGARVLLVDGEFEEDGPGEWLGESGHEGFLDIARYGASPRTALQKIGFENVDLMGVGSYRPRESEPLSGEEVRGALRQLRMGWNFILITAPARSADGDYNPIFSCGDGVVMGLALKGEARDRFEALAEDLMEKDVSIFGVMAFPEGDQVSVEVPAEVEREELDEREGISGSTSPYARSAHEHRSSLLFRRVTLGIAVTLIAFVGLWAGIQWYQKPRTGSNQYASRARKAPAPLVTLPAQRHPTATVDSSAAEETALIFAGGETMPPDSVKSRILTGDRGGKETGRPASSPLHQSEEAEALSSEESSSAVMAEDPLALALKLRSEDGYALHPWSFPDSIQALPSARALRAAGLKPLIVAADIPGKGTWYRVIVGNYSTRREALKARSLLLTRRDVDYVGVVKVGH